MARPDADASHRRSVTASAGSSTAPATQNTTAAVTAGWAPSSRARAVASVYAAYDAPAPRASATPVADRRAPPPLRTSKARPHTDSAVATAQAADTRRDTSPASSGAEPIATSVPTATPVETTAARNVSWNRACPKPASSVCGRRASARQQGQQQPRTKHPQRPDPGGGSRWAQHPGGPDGAEEGGGEDDEGGTGKPSRHEAPREPVP